jgi:hypothetical protein
MTAEEWVNNYFEKQVINEDIYASKTGIIDSHIIFAKYHVEAALKAAFEQANYPGLNGNQDKVLTSYPLENIK